MALEFPIELEFRNVDFWGGRKTGEPGEKPSELGREPTTNSTHIWRRVRESNPGHIGGRRALSPLRHPSSPSRGCQRCSYHNLTSSVIYYWTDARQDRIYLFDMIRKKHYYRKLKLCYIFQNLPTYLESRPLSTLVNTIAKKAIFDVIYTKWHKLIGCYACQRFVIGPRLAQKNHARHCQTWPESPRFSWDENLQRKQDWTAKSTNLEGNLSPSRAK